MSFLNQKLRKLDNSNGIDNHQLFIFQHYKLRKWKEFHIYDQRESYSLTICTFNIKNTNHIISINVSLNLATRLKVQLDEIQRNCIFSNILLHKLDIATN